METASYPSIQSETDADVSEKLPRLNREEWCYRFISINIHYITRLQAECLMSAPVTTSFFYRLPNWWTDLISHTETTRNWEVFWSIYVTCNEARVHYFPAWSKTNPSKWNTNILPGSSVPEKATRVPSSRKAVAAAFLEILTVCWSPTNGTTQ